MQGKVQLSLQNDAILSVTCVGDGNCLLHAVYLAICGSVDTAALGRAVLHENMSSFEMKDSVRARWQHHRERDNASIPGGLTYTTEV